VVALKLTDGGWRSLPEPKARVGELREVEKQIRSGRGELHEGLRISALVLFFSHLAIGRVAAEFSARYGDSATGLLGTAHVQRGRWG
jgi:hypothetical protein